MRQCMINDCGDPAPCCLDCGMRETCPDRCGMDDPSECIGVLLNDPDKTETVKE